MASAGPPPAPAPRPGATSMGFLRADVGGSKQPPAPYKAVRAACAWRPCRVRSRTLVESASAGLGSRAPSSPRGTPAGRGSPGSRQALLRWPVKRRRPAALPSRESARVLPGPRSPLPACPARRAPQEGAGRRQVGSQWDLPDRAVGTPLHPLLASKASPPCSVWVASSAVPSLRATAGGLRARAL